MLCETVCKGPPLEYLCTVLCPGAAHAGPACAGDWARRSEGHIRGEQRGPGGPAEAGDSELHRPLCKFFWVFFFSSLLRAALRSFFFLGEGGELRCDLLTNERK